MIINLFLKYNLCKVHTSHPSVYLTIPSSVTKGATLLYSYFEKLKAIYIRIDLFKLADANIFR